MVLNSKFYRLLKSMLKKGAICILLLILLQLLLRIITEPLNNAEKINVSKLCMDVCYGKRWAWGGISQITLTLKKGTIKFNLKSNETHLNLIRPPIP